MKFKKNIISAVSVFAAALALTGCAANTAAAAEPNTGNMLVSFLPLIIIFGMMYVMTILPENKRKKKAQAMRDAIEVGDKITTIGGMVGKVVHVTNDRITFETGEDRVRIEVVKAAISINEGKGANKETEDSGEALPN